MLQKRSDFILINETKDVGRYWTTTISNLMSELEEARTELEGKRSNDWSHFVSITDCNFQVIALDSLLAVNRNSLRPD